jgi:capsular polysaccharide biosynthesis protein
LSTSLQFSYPENYNESDKEIFYFLDHPEELPEAKVVSTSGWWDVAQAKKTSKVLTIFSALSGYRKRYKKLSSATWVTNQFSKNYFHWFNDVLPRLMLLEQSGIKCPIMLFEDVAAQQYVQETLSTLGWEHVTVSLNTVCKIDHLYLPDMTAADGSQHPLYFRSVCRKLIGNYKTPKRKIFISRQDSPYRNIIPNAPFEALLSAKGIEIVKTDNMSVAEQISLFKECSHLIAVHGAGLTNMAFMPEGKGKVLEIRRSDDKLNYCYFKMANVLNHKYYYYLAKGECVSKPVQLDNVIVDINDFEQTINQFLEEDVIQDQILTAKVV